MYHNGKDSLEKLSVEAQIYTMNYLEGSRSGYAWSEFTFNCVVFSEAYGCPCADDWEEWRCCCRYTKGALLHRNIDIESSLKGKKSYISRRRIPLPFFCFQAQYIMETMSLEVFVL